MIPIRYTWIAFALCLIVISGAMGWMSLLLIQTEHAERTVARQYENERLALWRIDSAVIPLIAQESSRPHLVYNSFYEAQQAYSLMLQQFENVDILVPSPLLTFDSPYISLHFLLYKDGVVTSPQVPKKNYLDLAETRYSTQERIDSYAERLVELKAVLAKHDLPSRLESSAAVPVESEQEQQPAVQAAQTFDPNQEQSSQIAKNINEQRRRSRILRSADQLTNSVTQDIVQNGSAVLDAQVARLKLVDKPLNLKTVQPGPIRAVWLGKTLVLARKTVVGDKTFVLGCVLNSEAIETWLISEVDDLLPAARLKPVKTNSAGQPFMMASLPIELIPGVISPESLPTWSGIRSSLVVAWCGLLLAALAVASLLLATVRLSERRGAFVSAVTHELRTPLTTFRMYTEMLADGVIEGEKKQYYLETLRVEAERLGHLVENVLSYAQLENTKSGVVKERINLREFFSRIEDRLRRRTQQDGMILELTGTEDREVVIHADADAIERILVNLIDNACKYAAGSSDPHIHVRYERNGVKAIIRVWDHGSGISRLEAKRLFHPFSKSASDAAHSAPGVGLGLALSRRLARGMDGDLRVDESMQSGACFVLTVPTAESEH